MNIRIYIYIHILINIGLRLTLYKYSYCDVSRLSRVFWMPLAKARWVYKPNSAVLCASSRRGYKNLGEKSGTVFSNFVQCWYLQRIGLPKRKKSRTVCSA